MSAPLRRILIPREVSLDVLRGLGAGMAVDEFGGTSMGTNWKLSCVIPPSLNRAAIHESVTACCDLVVRQMSHWDAGSDLCRFNRAEAQSWHLLPPEFLFVLQEALALAAQTSGAYDPTIGRLIDLYGFGPLPPPPSDLTSANITLARQQSGWQHIQIDSQSGAVLQPGGVELNLSSIAKGYAVDLVAAALTNLGVAHYMIEVGGELRGSGCKPNGMPWWCLLENPPDACDVPETLIALCGMSVATSGDTVQQRTTATGRRISHLIDPRTGEPACNELAAVSVLHADCLQADAWATALFVLGSEQGLRMAEQNQLCALFTLRTSSGYSQRWSSPLEPMLQ